MREMVAVMLSEVVGAAAGAAAGWWTRALAALLRLTGAVLGPEGREIVAAGGIGVGVGVGVLSSRPSSRVRLLERLQAVDVAGWVGLLVVETEYALARVDADVESSAMEMDELDQLVESEGGQGSAGRWPV